MMKKSSTYAPENGIRPAAKIASFGFIEIGGSGIARAIVLVTVGKAIASFLYPKNAPTNTNGMDTQHHITAKIRISKNGADPEEW